MVGCVRESSVTPIISQNHGYPIIFTVMWEGIITLGRVEEGLSSA